MSEQSETVAIISKIVFLIGLLIVVAGGYEFWTIRVQHETIRRMVEKGHDPMVASCAVLDRRYDPQCIIIMSKEGP